MDEPQAQENAIHPFEQFKATMRKLVKVSKADLDAQLKRHAETTHKQRSGPKPGREKAN